MENKVSENRYKLTVRGNAKMLKMVDSFATTGEYTLSYFGYHGPRPELKEYMLEEHEVKLTEYHDPNTFQIIQYVNKIACIYNRQHVCVSGSGDIKGLLNLPEIKTKWDTLKKELMQTNPIAAFEVIRHKDRELANPPDLIDNLANSHFMHLFLYSYNATADNVTYTESRKSRDRMGIGFLFPVNVTYTTELTDGKYVTTTESVLNEKSNELDKKLITQVTGEKELDVKHYTKATFERDVQGNLLSAHMQVFEQLNNDYKTDLYLDLESI
ncbi:hypothetical protein D0C36_12645 [Mucilaginibacter conchicola]|uniref:Uncharacterized protein n=1 Tax=Mucilaginibacter conchicola TaxID=2303333 RepID=A0A372NT32_9SPHI|nr:hypothetical protein [Mucilaginibacter conchicola]RFZ92282.1 hypothetical protein D0C36_12645 [Mucilaginibacter conchicola]